MKPSDRDPKPGYRAPLRREDRDRSGPLLKLATGIADRLTDVYISMARVDPWRVSPLEIRMLRRSTHPPMRACAVTLWARRRPGSFLGAAASFLRDDAPEVRAATMDGLADAAMLLELSVRDQRLERLLAAGGRDPSAEVRRAAAQTADLLRE